MIARENSALTSIVGDSPGFIVFELHDRTSPPLWTIYDDDRVLLLSHSRLLSQMTTSSGGIPLSSLLSLVGRGLSLRGSPK